MPHEQDASRYSTSIVILGWIGCLSTLVAATVVIWVAFSHERLRERSHRDGQPPTDEWLEVDAYAVVPAYERDTGRSLMKSDVGSRELIVYVTRDGTPAMYVLKDFASQKFRIRPVASGKFEQR